MFNALNGLLAPLIDLLEKLLQLVQRIWSKLAKYIDKTTARILLIVLTMLFVTEVLLISMLLSFAVILLLVYV